MIIDNVVAISRLLKDADNSRKESYILNQALSAVEGQVQPATSEHMAVAGGIYGQTYVFYTTQSGIFAGDLLTVSGTGDTYHVRGIEDWSQIEGAPHYEIVLIKFEDNEIIVD